MTTTKDFIHIFYEELCMRDRIIFDLTEIIMHSGDPDLMMQIPKEAMEDYDFKKFQRHG